MEANVEESFLIMIHYEGEKSSAGLLMNEILRGLERAEAEISLELVSHFPFPGLRHVIAKRKR
jgi:hypothetical protein